MSSIFFENKQDIDNAQGYGLAPVDDCLSYSFWCSVVYCQPHVFTPFYTIDKTDKKTYTFSGGLSFIEIGLLLLSRGGAL